MDHFRQNPPGPASKPAIALLGGVFYPPHQGHIDIGLSALELAQVEEVRWIPCAEIPHHKAPPIAPAQARLEMVELICGEIAGFTVDDVEFRRRGPSYTVDTVKSLSEAYPGQTLLWIVGADNARSMARWKSADELWQIAVPIVAPRPGLSQTETGTALLKREDFPYIGDQRWQLFLQWQLPALSKDVSSSEIRSLLRESSDPHQLTEEHPGIPQVIADYLLKGGWYASSQE